MTYVHGIQHMKIIKRCLAACVWELACGQAGSRTQTCGEDCIFMNQV